MGDRGPQSSGVSAGEGSQVWVSCHYSYDIGKAMVLKKIIFSSPLPLSPQGMAIIHPPASLCSGQPLVPTSKKKKCRLDHPEVGESRNEAFLVMLFSLRTVPHFDNTGQKKGKNEGSCQQELAKKILPDQASGL